MKRKTRIWLCLLLALLLSVGGVCIYAAGYSSAEDPLISLSYVNEVLLPLIKDMISGNRDISSAVATVPAATAPAATAPAAAETFPAGTVSTGARFATVQLKAGQTLFASVYSCEVILRSGKAQVVSPFTVKWEEQGVSDTTDGVDLFNGTPVPTNHTLLIPRDDGRGITVGEGGAWLMVRGDYRIQ